jgi:hypothetical protein
MQKRVVICGSMSNYPDLLNWCEKLNSSGIPCIVPSPDPPSSSPEDSLKFKRDVALEYFRKIAEDSTFGILVVNTRKHDKEHYIGANAFAEIALAFYNCKRIYILQEICDNFADELSAWGALPLRGDLDPLIQDFRQMGA